ncbi:hybrid sensor histidine kinase/response regulator transcription factor [Bacteroides sp. UBA939]|uniref:hybrid sensor histidine kinase/response regulator transcription factor n=1 Tax=Bacteroides sp. UBA939 TaxID=1946092 RepID=UPI0025C32AE9|nr:hybrid sensor histidine kinase/response regulator transcription factor [Bacteroides sp. UBA939]
MKRLILLIISVVLLCFSTAAQHFMFKRLEVKDGLPSNQINAIHRDSRGFMWFGTASGLARYDGYRFKVFHGSDNDLNSLPDSYIEKIVEDGEGRLWIRTGETGYVIYNWDTESFVRDVRPYLKNIGIDEMPRYVFVDSRKSIWFAVDGKGCYRYRSGEEKAELLPFGDKGIPGGTVMDMTECKDGIVLVYDNGHVICIDREKMEMKWTLTDIAETMGKHTEIFFLYVDNDDDLWIYGAPGVWAYNMPAKKWQSQWNLGDRGQAHVVAIAQDKQGRIWFGKDQDGIDIWNKATGENISLTYNVDDERGLPNNTINVLYEDEGGVMWLGTYKKGVAYYNESIFKFSINHLGDINCLEECGNGSLWLGSNDAGLIRWNSRTDERELYTYSPAGNSVASNVIVSLLQARDGRLWIGTFWEGMDCFDGQRFVNYRNRPGDANSLANNNVWALAEDKDGNIWIATLGGGLQCLNPKTGKFTTYDMENSGIISNHIATICITRDNRLIIGTATSGVAIMDLNTRKITNMTGNLAGTVRFSNQSINQVYEDSRGLIWIGTRDGLNLYDPKNDHLQQVVVGQDETKQLITGITEDDNKNMWVTTANGVVNIVPSIDAKTGDYTFHYYMYDDKDGLQGSEFNQRSIRRLSSGEIAMGGMYGLNTFRPDEIKYNRILPKVMFTGFELFNNEVEIGKEYRGRILLRESLNKVREIKLDYVQNVFTVLFASDNYILPDKTHYSYKLEGFNEDWLLVTADMHRVTYTNLAPGTYTLKVKAINSDGYAGTEEASLKIIIRPPFWMTPYAFIIYVLLLAGGLVFARNAVLRRERNKFRIQQMKQEAEKNEEVNQMKFRFFTNVSHELRTPLTLIISPLEGMIKETADEKKLTQLKLMHRNALRLLNLLNQLLDFRKNEVAGLHLNLSEGEVVSYIHNICNSFLILSEKKNVHLTFFSAVESLNMSFDEDKIGKIVMNLLSNAFKFTPEGGRVDVSLELVKGDTDILEIKVSDTGVGISDIDKERIFERFYQSKQKSNGHLTIGSGIGLSLVRDYVTLHGGVVRVFDNIGAGSVFVVDIPAKHSVVNVVTPLSEEAAKEDEAVLASVANDTQMTGERELLPEGEKKKPAVVNKEEKKKPLALIVDDNEDFVSFMRYSLSLYFRVESAANGRDAWLVIPELMPDIIVSDVMMPEIDGNELCRWVKTDKRTGNIPFILLTARQSVENKVEGLTIGADDYVTKPFNMEVLILRMRKLIDLSSKNRLRTHIDPEPSEIVITSMDEKLIENAIRYVEKNIARPELSVEELSHELSMSRVHLYKKLLQITGKTPIEFIRIIRLKRAAQLLRESQQNVSEVAYQVGFNNPKYFSKYFKDEFGVLPSIYQEKEGR